MVQYHAGFGTYLLVVVMGILVIGLVDPPLFQQIVGMIGELGRAARGG